jgi:hypothetical protein
VTAAVVLLADAAARGVRVRIHESGKLAVSGSLDDQLREQLRAHRNEVVAHLAAERRTAPCATCGKFAFPITEPPVICFWCGRRMTDGNDTNQTGGVER